MSRTSHLNTTSTIQVQLKGRLHAQLEWVSYICQYRDPFLKSKWDAEPPS
jgi:hypothetical protein